MSRKTYERFQIKQEKVKVLTVTVVKANNGAESFWSKLFNFAKPDPYVMLRIRTSPNSMQQTTVKSNTYNPIWNENFTFYLNNEKKNTLELTMRDSDVGKDDLMGTNHLDLDDLEVDKEITEVLNIDEKTTLELKLSVKYDDSKELRIGHDLCDEEKDFLKKRKEVIFKHMPRIMGETTAPKSIGEVPVIAIMGSGGGYRAACGFSGVFCALQESGVLDCSTYVTGLSGSSWYISTLYQHEGWPGEITCREMADDLRKKYGTSMWSHFRPHFLKHMKDKRRKGQPVRLVDFFGQFIGDCLLDNKESKLSNQGYKIKYGEAPLPITTGIRVRLDLPAAEFSEWMEFTPFEYGIAKYGVFGKAKDFGAKFYKGRLVKPFEEPPLSYLQGIWGSAFGIILHTLFFKKDESENDLQQEIVQSALDCASQCKTEDDESEEEDDESEEDDELPEDEIGGNLWLVNALRPDNLLTSRRGKAAEVFNMFRGLQFKSEQDKVEEYHNAPDSHKTMCLVDSGIAFNSPYPMLLRPEREVELILSFDFSQKDGGDKELPFKNILKAERWAKENGLPFPQIDGNIALENTDIQECYVFEDVTNSKCPIVLHFPLTNKTFREFSEPGVPRTTQEEKDFGNFDIFDDPKKPYSSFEFQYDQKSFDRLHELMRYNTLANMDTIKEKIASVIKFRQNNPGHGSQ